MSRTAAIACVGFALIAAVAANEVDTVFEFGEDNFRYYDRVAAPPDGWEEFDFDDRPWKIGREKFGHGNGDERTVTENKQAVYFRKTVEMDPNRPFFNPRLDLRIDDGVQIFLNGHLVERINVAAPVRHTTSATLNIHDHAENEIHTVFLPMEHLRPGTNVLAFSLHNFSRDRGRDLAFNVRFRTLYVEPTPSRTPAPSTSPAPSPSNSPAPSASSTRTVSPTPAVQDDPTPSASASANPAGQDPSPSSMPSADPTTSPASTPSASAGDADVTNPNTDALTSSGGSDSTLLVVGSILGVAVVAVAAFAAYKHNMKKQPQKKRATKVPHRRQRPGQPGRPGAGKSTYDSWYAITDKRRRPRGSPRSPNAKGGDDDKFWTAKAGAAAAVDHSTKHFPQHDEEANARGRPRTPRQADAARAGRAGRRPRDPADPRAGRSSSRRPDGHRSRSRGPDGQQGRPMRPRGPPRPPADGDLPRPRGVSPRRPADENPPSAAATSPRRGPRPDGAGADPRRAADPRRRPAPSGRGDGPPRETRGRQPRPQPHPQQQPRRHPEGARSRSPRRAQMPPV